MFRAEIWNISEFLSENFHLFRGKVFSTFELACFRNDYTIHKLLQHLFAIKLNILLRKKKKKKEETYIIWKRFEQKGAYLFVFKFYSYSNLLNAEINGIYNNFISYLFNCAAY